MYYSKLDVRYWSFMIFYIIKNITTNPGMVIITVLGFCLALVIGITVHEFSHALAASKQGDNTAKHLGRLSLNPIRHLDLFGTAMIFFVGIGWGKPTPVNSPVADCIAVFIPTTSPFMFRSGPPEFPGLIAASV